MALGSYRPYPVGLVAQRQSRWLITTWSKVRILPGPSPSRKCLHTQAAVGPCVPVMRRARTVPSNMERHVFAETRITAYRLKHAA